MELLTSGTITFLNPAVIDIFCVGGGSGGNGAAPSYSTTSGGGGSGKTNTALGEAVTGSYFITIGNGGQGGVSTAKYSSSCLGKPGGKTSFGNILSADGGSWNTTGDALKNGSAGGSGGGGAVDENSNYGNGGSDGGNGQSGYPTSRVGGTGQGSTTREFGESTGKLYAGGGGGARKMNDNTPIVSPGGEGGGGAGAWSGVRIDRMQAPTAGVANTGSGGGGGFYANNSKKVDGAPGGSGICCFRAAK